MCAPEVGPDRQNLSGDWWTRQNCAVADTPNPSQFVGRSDPVKRIEEAIRTSLSGRTGLVLVSGEAGIGKSALLSEAARSAGSAGVVGVWGTCWDAERAPGYWPWAQVVRQAIDHAGTDLTDEMSAADRADLGRLVPGLSSESSDVDDEHDAKRVRLRFFDAVARCLERMARLGPLMITLDDLQWADSSSLALLEFIVRAHRPVPMLIVGAYRHDELRPDAAALLTGIGARADIIRLQGLELSDVRTFLGVSASEELASKWAEEVHRRTAGHPFLVREVAHALHAEAPADSVPVAAHDLIAQRIGRLSTDCRRALEIAAVAGNDVLPDVVSDVADMHPTAIASQLEEAVRAGVLATDAGSGKPRFAHDLYRETICGDLPATVRLTLHQRVGAALERRIGRGGQVFAAEIARHYTAAAVISGAEPAIRWALLAAHADRARLAFAEAAGQLARVRTSLDDAGVTVGPAELVDLLVAQADAESRAGDVARARQLLQQARTFALDLDDAARLADVALGMQRLGARFAMPRVEIVALLEDALNAVQGSGSAVEAQVTASLARELHHSVPADRARAGPLTEQAVTIARHLDDPSTLATCLLARHDVLWTPGAAAERADVAREIVALAERSGDDERRSEGHLLTANALLEAGSPSFRTELNAFFLLEAALAQPRHDYMALTRRAAMALLEGDLDDAERLIQSAAALGERVGEPDVGNVRMTQLLELARARNSADELRSTAAMAVEWWVGVPSHAHAVAAGLFAQAGDLDSAREALDTVRGLNVWHTDRSYLWSMFVPGLVVAAARLGDSELNEELLTALTPLGDACGVGGAVVCFTGSHAHWAGVAAKNLGRHELAADLLQRGLRVHQRIGARHFEAASLAELAGLNGRDPSSGATATCRRDGDVWTLGYRGRSTHLRNAKGLQDLALLLARPGEDVHALELMASPLRTNARAGPVLDAQARADYRRRLAELDEDFSEAQTNSDIGAMERVEFEREALYGELRRATGHTGKDRGLGATAVERSRKAVSARLRDTISRIKAALPELGNHLDRSIVTGNYCRYQPTEPITWDL